MKQPSAGINTALTYNDLCILSVGTENPCTCEQSAHQHSHSHSRLEIEEDENRAHTAQAPARQH